MVGNRVLTTVKVSNRIPDRHKSITVTESQSIRNLGKAKALAMSIRNHNVLGVGTKYDGLMAVQKLPFSSNLASKLFA